jgi:hypothetical protein
MMTFLAWDPSAMQKAPLTYCSLPVRHSFKGAEKYKGNWTILEIVGRIMESDARSGKTIRGLVFDAHGSHAFVRRVIFGDFEDVCRESVKKVPFFRHLEHRELPNHRLPRLPLRIALYEGEPIFCMVGPCFSDLLSTSELQIIAVGCLLGSLVGCFL